jgi:hypothetical protein
MPDKHFTTVLLELDPQTRQNSTYCLKIGSGTIQIMIAVTQVKFGRPLVDVLHELRSEDLSFIAVKGNIIVNGVIQGKRCCADLEKALAVTQLSVEESRIIPISFCDLLTHKRIKQHITYETMNNLAASYAVSTACNLWCQNNWKPYLAVIIIYENLYD